MSDVRAQQVWRGKLKAGVLTAILGGAVLVWAGPSVVHVTPAHIRVLAVPSNDDCMTCYYYRHHRRHSGAPNAGPGIGQIHQFHDLRHGGADHGHKSQCVCRSSTPSTTALRQLHGGQEADAD
jgi:hypothetical protein